MDQRALAELVEAALDRADQIWKVVGHNFQKSAEARRDDDLLSTNIPGYSTIDRDKPAVDNFVALMVDIRNSTKHLLIAISAGASGLYRVLVETSALFVVVSNAIREHGGAAIEYLGDGALALFRCTLENGFDYRPYDAALECLTATHEIVNPALRRRYGLPAIEIGIGMAYSKAIVTAIGDNYSHPKVIGECVYRASRLCGERDAITIDEHMKVCWPKTKGGPILMRSVKCRDVVGYVVTRK